MAEDFKTVSFRIRKGDVKGFQFISDVLYQAKGLKRPSIGLLAKRCLIAESNLFFQFLYSAHMNGTTQPSSMNSSQ